MKYLNAWGKYCKLVGVPSFVMKMAISVGPDQAATLRMSFDQGLHCLTRPVRLNTCLGLCWLHATFFFVVVAAVGVLFLIIMYK